MKQLHQKTKHILKTIMLVTLTLLPITANANGELKTNANIAGHITSKATGEPIPHVAVQVEGTMIVSVTNAEGYYHLEDLPLGKQTIEARATGYHAEKQTIEVERTQSKP